MQDSLQQHRSNSEALQEENVRLERVVFAMRDMEAKISKGGAVQEQRERLAKEVRVPILSAGFAARSTFFSLRAPPWFAASR